MLDQAPPARFNVDLRIEAEVSIRVVSIRRHSVKLSINGGKPFTVTKEQSLTVGFPLEMGRHA